MRDRDRGTGRTSRQIMGAPEGALFVCKKRAFIPYCADLAKKLGRDDLTFSDLGSINAGYFRGNDIPMVFDHDCSLKRVA